MADEEIKKENNYAKFMDEDFELLKRFKEEAPGSYKHSKNVMEICSSIAIELGFEKEKADVLKVASMFHDIGKIINGRKTSIWFTENQGEDNPHDNIDPELSYQIISRHLSDGLVLLLRYDFPVEILKVISQHHGNAVVQYFFMKAKAKDEDKDKFRYPGPSTSDPLASILLVVDKVEAAAKSLYASGKLGDANGRDALVDDCFDTLVSDNQLDFMTYKVGKIIKKVLKQTLSMEYHDRESYEDVKENGVKKEKE